MGVELSPEQARRFRAARDREAARWRERNGPVSVRVVEPESIELARGRISQARLEARTCALCGASGRATRVVGRTPDGRAVYAHQRCPRRRPAAALPPSMPAVDVR